jgi:uncharacterized protein with PQ loop repeat
MLSSRNHALVGLYWSVQNVACVAVRLNHLKHRNWHNHIKEFYIDKINPISYVFFLLHDGFVCFLLYGILAEYLVAIVLQTNLR